MKSPARLFRSLHRRFRMRDQIMAATAELADILHSPVRLVPASSSHGGRDLILQAVVDSERLPHRVLASVRLMDPAGSLQPDEPDLPRRVLPAHQRLQTECAAYRTLSRHGLSPTVLVSRNDYLANSWLPWSRLSDCLRGNESAVWNLLPGCLQAIGRMHELGIVHFDLNCGNFLVGPAAGQIAFVDFEYAAGPGQCAAAQRAFDYLRFAQNLLRPRRALPAALRDPQRFLQTFEAVLQHEDVDGSDLPECCFERIRQHPVLNAGFQRLMERPLRSTRGVSRQFHRAM